MGILGFEGNRRLMYGSAGAGFELGSYSQDNDFLSKESSNSIGLGKRLRIDDQIRLDRIRKHRKQAPDSKEKVTRSNCGGGLPKKRRIAYISDDSDSDSTRKWSEEQLKKKEEEVKRSGQSNLKSGQTGRARWNDKRDRRKGPTRQ